MNNIGTSKLDMTKDIMSQCTITIEVVGKKQWAVRMWIGTQLIHLAARIMNMKVQIGL